MKLAANALALVVIVFLSLICARWAQSRSAVAAVDRISVADFLREQGARLVLTVDVRSEAAFRRGHIPGALSVPLAVIGDHVTAIRQAARKRLVVTYCACPAEHASADAAARLAARGVVPVAALVGGIDAWANAGGPLEKTNDYLMPSAAASSVRNFRYDASLSTLITPRMR